jgi:hypothetical protein
MNTENGETHPSKGANGSQHVMGLEYVLRAKAMVVGFPANFEAQIRRKPYATVGIACAIGIGTGILLGSRILRSALASAASYAVVELARSYLRPDRGSTDATDPSALTDTA